MAKLLQLISINFERMKTMRTINEMLKPRENVFSDTAREDVLNLTDLAENRINANKFFIENFQTVTWQTNCASREAGKAQLVCQGAGGG